VKEHDHRAQAVYQAAGFTIEGMLRERLKTECGYESLIVMSLLQQEYKT
jgi:RimJ/RimL family protein N-acetyltransferase